MIGNWNMAEVEPTKPLSSNIVYGRSEGGKVKGGIVPRSNYLTSQNYDLGMPPSRFTYCK